MLAVWALLSGPAAAQTSNPEAWSRVKAPIWSSLVAGVAAAAPGILGINERDAACAPCGSTAVPTFDRWAIRPPVSGWSLASDVALVGLGTALTADIARQDNGLRRSAVMVESVAWTFALTQVTKALVARKRPVLYTEAAGGAVDEVDAQRSFPSGHTAVAFALATGYWLDGAGHRTVAHWAALGGAAAIGAARVAAAAHFPSDVLAGAALGAATAVLVHEIRF
jgi:membrane-associated phospholipid phosphatase